MCSARIVRGSHPARPGHWREPNSHTLVFTPSGFGAALGSQLRVQLPHPVAVTAGAGSALRTTSQIEWTVPSGSTLRLQQLLAQAGYLPVDWQPAHAPTSATRRGRGARSGRTTRTAVFTGAIRTRRFRLQAMWAPGRPGVITSGAVMAFENEDGLTADGVSGADRMGACCTTRSPASAWPAATATSTSPRPPRDDDALARWPHRSSPPPANTGISGAETALGTYPVFEHLPETTMSGTNPDGSHYSDPGIKWVSYFNGGDALHNFDRSSFGTPQSLGCVELPLAASAEIYPYTPIGTLVTVET